MDFEGKAPVSGPRGAAARGTAPYAMALFAAYADVLGPSFQSVAASHGSVFNQLVGHMNQCSISWLRFLGLSESVLNQFPLIVNQCSISSPC